MNLSQLVRDYIQQRCDDKLEKLEKAALKEIKVAEKAGQKTASLVQSHNEKKESLQKQHTPENWLTDAAGRASQISLVTHAAKFSHSDSKATGLTATIEEPDGGLLGTHSLAAPVIDVVGNAAALDVANLLLLANEGSALWHQIRDNNGESLQTFAANDGQLSEWIAGFRLALEVTRINSHSLSKQLYFPIAENEYHLVSPLFPSSVADRIFRDIQASRFSAEAKAARDQKRKGNGASADVISYPNVLRMNFGGSKPQNISLLNSRRGGKAYLFSAAPPVWEDKLQLPIEHSVSFWRLLDRRANRIVYRLRRFLGSKAHQPNNAVIKTQRESYVTEIVDVFVFLVAELRRTDKTGWSSASALPLAEQCMLDPERRQLVDKDSEFVRMLDDKSWLDEVADSFGRWLNRRLRKIKTEKGEILDNPGDVEQHVWRQELDHRISRMRNELECLL